MNQEDKATIEDLIKSGKVDEALQNLHAIIIASSVSNKDNFARVTFESISNFNKSKYEYLLGRVSVEDHHKVFARVTGLASQMIYDFEKAIDQYEEEKKQKEAELKQEEITSRVKKIVFILALISCFYFKEYLSEITLQLYYKSKKSFIDVTANGNSDEIKLFNHFENIFTPAFFYSILFGFLFYQSYLLLYYTYKVFTIDASKIKEKPGEDLKLKKIKLYFKYITTLLFSLFIGYFINTLFDKDVIKSNDQIIQFSTFTIFFVMGLAIALKIALFVDSIGRKNSQSNNLVTLFSILICFILYHGYCSYRGGLLSKNVIMITEKVIGVQINSPLKEFFDFTTSMIQPNTKDLNKKKK